MLKQITMQVERVGEVVMNMPAGRVIQVAVSIVPIERVRAVINDDAGALQRR